MARHPEVLTRVEDAFECRLDGVRVASGPSVDGHLRRHGALAQAWSSRTILLSRRVRTLGPRARLLVLLHELAHTIQLSRPGTDDTRELEREAWHAARCALEGRRAEVRGRAGGSPTNPGLFARAFVDAGGFSAAVPFYRAIPWVVTGRGQGLALEHIDPVRPMTLEGLLQRIASAMQREEDLVVVSHGTADGLSMPLVPGSNAPSDIRVLDLLDSDFRTAEEVAQVAGLPDPPGEGARKVAELRRLATEVKRKVLGQVELRACNIGGSEITMRSLKRFFGAGRLGAPRMLNAYGVLDPGQPVTSDQQWQRWQAEHPNHREYRTSNGGKIAMSPHTHELSRGRVDVIVDASASFAAWIDRFLAAGHAREGHGGGRTPYHAAWNWTASFPAVWPGTDEYADQIVHV